MRIIQRTISLEPITSRVPSVWPAYKDNKLYFFDDDSLREREYEYPTNYGMIPLSLSALSSTLSFERVCNRYAFFKKYNRLLNCSAHCERVYSSATDYYNTQIDSRYANEMEYGQDEETYIEIDEAYENMGGDAFSKWINENIIPTYEISKDYRGYWKREYLYYSDVIKWIAWFKEREYYDTSLHIYTAKTDIDIEHWDCKDSGVTDCCDCEEYFNRGGARELSSMLNWYNSIQRNIRKIKNAVLDNQGKVLPNYVPTINEHIILENSLENIGQYSVLSPEFEEGIDYRVANYGDSSNTKSGTTIIDASGNTRILTSNETPGFCFSPIYMEKTFDDNAWGDYTLKYISGNPQEFVSSSYKYYAFDEDNKFYSGMTTEEVRNAMTRGDSYSIIPTDSILINESLIPIETSEYGIYESSNNLLSGRTYFVYREKDTYTPYTIINGKKIYADSYFSTSGMCYYFSFFPNNEKTPPTSGCHNDTTAFNINDYKIFGRKKTSNINELITYITYNDKTYVVDNDNYITINDITYYRINGYTYDKNGEIIYLSNGTLYDSELFELDSTYTLSYDNKTIYVDVYNNDVIIYNAKEITGLTISKLSDLASTNKLCDDTGNDIDGIYNDTCRKINNQSSAMTYAQPPMYTVLEPLYQVGNTSLIGKFKLTEENAAKLSAATSCNYFIGNIITNMEFYYKDVNGNKVSETSVQCNSGITSLSAITSATTAMNDMNNNNSEIVFDENLYCDIEYYIGATLKRTSGSPFVLADSENYNYGVKYNETVKFVKTPVFFRLKMEPEADEIMPTQRYETENLPHKYVIYTYNMEQELTSAENDLYDTLYQVPLARFTSEINLIDEDLTPNFSGYSDMDTYNGVKVSPVFKEEYKMGLSMMEKVDSDIYIDRGVNAAFEKHLKLQEVNSLESLEQFGNGFFKIMDS